MENGKKVHLPHSAIVKSAGLLPMLYTARELATELAIPEPTLRDWLRIGAPFKRDERGHIWICGEDFSKWIALQRKVKTEPRLTESQAFCFHCKTIVEMSYPRTQQIRGKLMHLRGICSHCGKSIFRGSRQKDIILQANPADTALQSNRRSS